MRIERKDDVTVKVRIKLDTLPQNLLNRADVGVIQLNKLISAFKKISHQNDST